VLAPRAVNSFTAASEAARGFYEAVWPSSVDGLPDIGRDCRTRGNNERPVRAQQNFADSHNGFAVVVSVLLKLGKSRG
jgi:hypothetical protein